MLKTILLLFTALLGACSTQPQTNGGGNTPAQGYTKEWIASVSGKYFEVGTGPDKNVNTFRDDGSIIDIPKNVWVIHSVLSPTRAIYYNTNWGYFGYDLNVDVLTGYSYDGGSSSWKNPEDVVFAPGDKVIVSKYTLLTK